MKTEVLVTKEGGGGFLGIFGSKKPAIRLAFEDHTDGPETHFRRSVSLEQLSTGRYWIEVQIRDATGQLRRHRASFEVRE